MKKNTLKKTLQNLSKILISIILLYFVFQKIPFGEVTVLWKKTNIFFLLIGSFLFLISQIISTKRLALYFQVNNFNLSFQSNLKLYFLGMFYNFFIPGGIGGDAYKVYLLNQKFGWKAKKITSALFNDRLSGLLAICTLILFFSLKIVQFEWYWGIFILLILGIYATYFFTKKVFRIYVSIFGKAFLYSLMIQLLQVGSFIFLLKSIGFMGDFTIYAIVFLASSVLSLISFAGIGVREMLFLQAAHFFNFKPEISISASLLFTIITAFFSLFGVYFQIKKLNLKLN